MAQGVVVHNTPWVQVEQRSQDAVQPPRDVGQGDNNAVQRVRDDDGTICEVDDILLSPPLYRHGGADGGVCGVVEPLPIRWQVIKQWQE